MMRLGKWPSNVLPKNQASLTGQASGISGLGPSSYSMSSSMRLASASSAARALASATGSSLASDVESTKPESERSMPQLDPAAAATTPNSPRSSLPCAGSPSPARLA